MDVTFFMYADTGRSLYKRAASFEFKPLDDTCLITIDEGNRGASGSMHIFDAATARVLSAAVAEAVVYLESVESARETDEDSDDAA